jgi:Tfp pilus assembly protein PilN
MSAYNERVRINLLPQDEFASSSIGRVLTWALSTFRVIVIATEMVVMLAFLSRFWLDAKNTDLTEQLKQKQAIILSYSKLEKDFKDTQTRLKIFSSIVASGKLIPDALTTISSLLPPEAKVSNILFDGTYVQIKGVATNEQAIAQFMANLGADSSLSDTTLMGIDSNQLDKTLLGFKIRAVPKKKG